MRKIRIAGTIIDSSEKWIYNFFGMESFCFRDLKLSDEYEDLDIEINSLGGQVFAASEIYTSLKNHKGKVRVTITGLAASAATVIAMAGDVVKMSPTASFMIHNVSAQGKGDYRDMAHLSGVLKQANETVANAYMLKTGKTKEELLNLMNKETWLTAEQAKEHAFIDEVLFSGEEAQLVASVLPNTIPQNVIEKMQIEREQATLDLLKMKGV